MDRSDPPATAPTTKACASTTDRVPGGRPARSARARRQCRASTCWWLGRRRQIPHARGPDRVPGRAPGRTPPDRRRRTASPDPPLRAAPSAGAGRRRRGNPRTHRAWARNRGCRRSRRSDTGRPGSAPGCGSRTARPRATAPPGRTDPADQHHIDGVLSGQVGHRAEHRFLVGQQALPVEGPAEVPVGGVQHAHGGHRRRGVRQSGESTRGATASGLLTPRQARSTALIR